MRELSLHILDLIQNSIEAGASKVKVQIEENMAADYIDVTVSDNGKGMEPNLLKKVFDPFVTSRKTRKVGLGLPLIKMSAEHCGGYLTIQSSPGKGTHVNFRFKHSHWDRPPLGDIAQTIRNVIVSNPDLKFSYLHKVDDQMFQLDSGKIREILGDIPLSHPVMLTWLTGYLTEGIANLYGG